MKKFSILLLVFSVFLAGCGGDPNRFKEVSVREADRLAKPSKALSAFSSYELRPIVSSDQVKDDPDRIEQAHILEAKLKEKLLPLFAQWSSTGDSPRSGNLIVQPEFLRLRIVSGGARFWIGQMAGNSSIDFDLVLIDDSTGEEIAKPRIVRSGDAWSGAWTKGGSDKDLLDYTAHIAHQYFVSNY